MPFNSLPFLLFVLLFFIFWYFLKGKNRSRWTLLTVASLLFYGWWDWRFLFLILGSGLVDYVCALKIEKVQKKKIWLFISISTNLASLSIFKYSLFFADIFEKTLALFNLGVDLKGSIPDFALILPVGISFFTFQSMSYSIDVYRGRIAACKSIMHFYSYLTMFPQLVAGPVVRAKDMLIQLSKVPVASTNAVWSGIKMISYGLFQKVVLADNISFLVERAFGNKYLYDGAIYWWAATIGFTFQIYCDFSGYSLIAKGLAKCMGFNFKSNFNHPYLSKSMKEFWSRWHISISSWFKDYVYIPLGGNKKGKIWGMVFMGITMFLSGLWHGANYTFLVWALLHISYLVLERSIPYHKYLKRAWLSELLLHTIIIIQISIAWVFFRSNDVDQAFSIIKELFSLAVSFDFIYYYSDPLFWLLFAIVLELVIFIRKRNPALHFWVIRKNIDILLVAVAITMSIFFRGPEAQFIYFQF